MILVKIRTQKGDIYVTAEDENEAKSKATKYLKDRYFSEAVVINSTELLACSKHFYSDNTLVV